AAIRSIEEDRNISQDIIEEALVEALSKALKKHINANDANIKVDMDEETDEIRIYQVFDVVEVVENFDTELSLEEAVDDKADAVIGDQILLEHEISELGRPAALLAKNVLKQKIREAEKQGIYDEYIHQLYEMITVQVDTVEDRFLFVDLGKAHGIMPLSAQIPGEHYYEGQKLKVVISEVNKDSKGAQIIVSRSDDHFVRRLFEMEVPEIYQGVVEIKAIAREAGDRTKVAVFSKDPNIDPIGACIGPRGTRVQEVIEELQGEKIDIFEWTNDVDQLIKSSLAPAEVLYVLPTDDERSVTVVVADDQLSLAIGRGGKNAKLAVKLINKKIDIKSLTDIKALGIDYESIALANQPTILVEPEFEEVINDDEDYMQPDVEVGIIDDTTEDVVEVVEMAEDVVVEETEVNVEDTVEAVEVVEVIKEVVETPVKRVKKVEPREAKEEYVSKFEKLADPTIALQKIAEREAAAARRKARYDSKKQDQPEIDYSDLEYEIAPEYTDEELDAIEKQQEKIDNSWYEDEIDFEEFEDYYE
ncbi:MAG: transcription termination/antitermination protein NusA, partial [Erysipelothrix sp.]|nr:transcription termination/antitermination protein NusA [Erysipelothrix sp.]